MNQFLRCDWLPERAEWCSLSGLGITRSVPQETFPRKPYNKSFISCSLKMADYWPRFFFQVNGPRLCRGP